MNLTKAILLEFIQSELEEIIRKSGDKYCLYSKKKNPKTGKSRNLGCYPSRGGAEKREREVQYFKRMGEEKELHFSPNQTPSEADKVTRKCISEVKPKLKKSHPDWSSGKIEAVASQICQETRVKQGAPLDHGEKWDKNLRKKRPGGMDEQKWNKDNGRDYSKEYNAPGSKEQEERNKRKRDKRKHDKLYGECPKGTELHHTNGIENDEVECVPVSKNRGRKEKSRLKKVDENFGQSSFYGGDISVPLKKQAKRQPGKSLAQLKKELAAALRKEKVGVMNYKDQQEFDERVIDIIDRTIGDAIEAVAKDYTIVGKKKLEEELTMRQFLSQVNKEQGAFEKLLGSKTAKVIAKAIPTLVGAGAGALVSNPAVGSAAASAGEIGTKKAIERGLSLLKVSLPELLLKLLDLPDEQTVGTIYRLFDLDDEEQALARGGLPTDGPILKAFEEYLLDKYKQDFRNLTAQEMDEPVTNFVTKTATQHFNDFLANDAKGIAGSGETTLNVAIKRKIVEP
jgi:hypothetical protein